MKTLHTLPIQRWEEPKTSLKACEAAKALESGKILYFPNLEFELQDDENQFLSPKTTDESFKNVSYDASNGNVRGTPLEGDALEILRSMMHRFSQHALSLLQQVLPEYKDGLIQARTSFRTVEVEGRHSSHLKDDTQLHVDAFPSTPTQGKRILRVFSNVNPKGKSRVWRVGTEPLETTAARFWDRMDAPLPGSHFLMKLFGITRGLRTDYDHYMLRLHNFMKMDPDYQKDSPQEVVKLPPNTSWIVYTDQVPHAVMSGQFILEQTFYLPIEAMADPLTSPLEAFEKLAERPLI